MAFNSHTYHANKYAKEAYRRLDEARAIKARALLGESYAWEIDRLPGLVKLARIAMHLSLSERRLRELSRARG